MSDKSFSNLTARERIQCLSDDGVFIEMCPSVNFTNSHLKSIGLDVREDDGVIIGKGKIDGETVIFISQDGSFYGGSVGEIHGAKIKGILDYALNAKPEGVIFLIDSGGVRLQEANAGLVALSEIIKALLHLRSMGMPVIAVIGGYCGAFGGMGILARLCSEIIMTERGRMGLSGPEVIQTVRGEGEFNSHDRELVIKTVGAYARKEIGEVNYVVSDSFEEVRKVIVEALKKIRNNPLSLYDEIFAEHEVLKKRLMDCKNEQ